MANGNGKKKKKKYYIIGGIAGLVAVLATTLALSGGGTKIEASKLAKVERGDLAKSVVATGKVEPITKAEIKSKASGIVKRILADAGDRVKQGQVLVELDKEEIQARVRAARAQLEGAQASHRAAEADLERAKVDAEGPDVPLLKRAYERAQGMAKEGVVSPAQLDEAQKNYEMAVNKQNIARANLIVGKSKVAQAEAAIAQARANLEQAQEEYRNSTIVSPIAGLLLSRDVEVGDAVSSILVLGSTATLVMTVGDVHEVYVKGKVDESDVGKIDIGRQARIKVESFKDKSFSGKVTKISPMGTEKDNVTTFEVRVSIDNATGELKANMTANAEIILEEHKSVLMIPEGAIVYDNEKKASVELADPKAKEGKKKTPITVGISNGAKTEVLSGLNEGQQVVLQ